MALDRRRVAAAAVACSALLLAGTGYAARSSVASGRAHAAGPVPAGTTAASVTFVSPTEAFVLGTAACAHHPCTAILKTTDRGGSWKGLPAPLQGISVPGENGLWGLRFADANHGYAYGDGLWETSDGAASWHRAPVPGIVQALEAVNDRELVAVIARCADGSPGCASRLTLYHRPVAGGSWQRLATTGPNAFDAAIAVHHAAVWVLFGRRLFVSTDGGSSFHAHSLPCLDNAKTSDRTPVSLADTGTHTYLLCIGEGFTGHTTKQLFRITGTGSDWTLVGRPPALGDGGELAAGSDGAIVIASSSGVSLLYRSTDGGRHWKTVIRDDDGGEGWRDLGFTTAGDGVVIHGPAVRDGGSSEFPGQLLLTENGGASWQVEHF
jgi:hypothetical protein